MIDGVDTKEPYPPHPEPPTAEVDARRWMRDNLFGTVTNAVLTVIFGAVLAWVLFKIARFVLVTADWEIIRVNLTSFMVGRFPREELWRVVLASFVLVTAFGLRWGAATHLSLRTGRAWFEMARRMGPLLALAAVLVILSGSFVVAAGTAGVFAAALAARAVGRRMPAPVKRWSWIATVVGIVVAYQVIAGFGGSGFGRWGGLLLTVFLAIGGIALSFPLGVLLALGRRSSFPALRMISVAYIELIRGVPLITLLFMAFLTLGFFLPAGWSTPSLVARALVALVLFTAAYLAEVVRGGLQAVPQSQTEAAQALGLSPFRITTKIVLPQALRAVIPAIVGQFISLFKDTSLVAGIGLIELLGVAQQVTKQPDFLGRGLHAETLMFASFVYWAGAYWMSRTSQRLERKLGVGQR